MGINPTELIEYKKFFNYHLGLRDRGRKYVRGRFRDKGSPKIYIEELHVLNYNNNAKKSYEATIKYFNYTRTGTEKERMMVSAEWIKELDTPELYDAKDVGGEDE